MSGRAPNEPDLLVILERVTAVREWVGSSTAMSRKQAGLLAKALVDAASQLDGMDGTGIRGAERLLDSAATGLDPSNENGMKRSRIASRESILSYLDEAIRLLDGSEEGAA